MVTLHLPCWTQHAPPPNRSPGAPLPSPLQATRHLGFNPWHLQYVFITVTLVLLLALSLPINGTNWGEDLAGWTAADWSVLAVLGSVINIGTNLTMQREPTGWACACRAARGVC